MAEQKPQKINPEDVKGLPKGACIQSNKYVYFSYAFRRNGKPVHERDYLGTISEDMVFIPNDYYKLYQPVRENRPVENWKDPDQRRRAEEKLKDQQIGIEGLDVDPNEEVLAGVGVTALAMSILYESGMVEDVGNATLKGNVADTMHALNIGIHSAVTADPTYLAQPEARVLKFIGRGCLSSPRASEFLTKLGQMKEDLSLTISQARGKRINSNDLLALDGTRVTSYSKNIALAEVGKDKNGGFSQQINYSMLVNASTGSPVGYRLYAGNFNDVKTLEDFRTIWDQIGVAQKQTTILLDRGYFNQAELIDLNNDGIRFIVGAKNNINVIKDIIENDNHYFYSALRIMENGRCYGLRRPVQLRSSAGKTCDVNAFVYRDPVATMDKAVELKKELERFQKNWLEGAANKDDDKLRFFKDPKVNQPLELDEQTFDLHCYDLGFFAFVSNCDLSLEEALNRYSMRNEAEVAFKQMLGGMMRATRVHSTHALYGQVFTTFIGLSILTGLRTRLKNLDSKGKQLCSTYTVRETFKTLQKVMLRRDPNGRCRLLNVTKKEKDLVKALGFDGLFDSADSVYDLLSAKRLADHLRTAKN